MTQIEAHGEEKLTYLLTADAQSNIVRLCFVIQMWKQGVIQNPVIRLKCACLCVCVLNFFVLKSETYYKLYINYIIFNITLLYIIIYNDYIYII